MKDRQYEIVKRPNGYYIKDGGFGYLNGPYDTVEEASKDVPRSGQLQYPLEGIHAKFNQSILQDELSDIE